MPRLPIAIAFLAGLSCAVLLGAAAPAPAGKPITWEYRLLDEEEEGRKLAETARALGKTNRLKFASDDAANEAARIAARNTWLAELATDGWFVVGDLEVGMKICRVLARPVGHRVESSPSAVDYKALCASGEAAEIAFAKQYGPNGRDSEMRSARDVRHTVEWEAAVTAFAAAGKSGHLIVPWREYGGLELPSSVQAVSISR